MEADDGDDGSVRDDEGTEGHIGDSESNSRLPPSFPSSQTSQVVTVVGGEETGEETSMCASSTQAQRLADMFPRLVALASQCQPLEQEQEQEDDVDDDDDDDDDDEARKSNKEEAEEAEEAGTDLDATKNGSHSHTRSEPTNQGTGMFEEMGEFEGFVSAPSNVPQLDTTQRHLLAAALPRAPLPRTYPFQWKRSMIQLLHYAYMGVATAIDDDEFAPSTRTPHGASRQDAEGASSSSDEVEIEMYLDDLESNSDDADSARDHLGPVSNGMDQSQSNARSTSSSSQQQTQSPPSKEETAADTGDKGKQGAKASRKAKRVRMLKLQPHVTDDSFLDVGSSFLSAGESLFSGLSTAGGFLGSIVLDAGTSLSRAASSVTSSFGNAGTQLSGTIRGNLSRLHRIRRRTAADSEAGETMGLTPEERRALDEKLQEMEEILQDELKQLQEQELDIYVVKFNEALEIQQKIDEVEEMMRRKNEEVCLQRKIQELEAREEMLNPEPDQNQAELSGGDDKFTIEMKERGLSHVNAQGEAVRLTQSHLPPKFDLSKFT